MVVAVSFILGKVVQQVEVQTAIAPTTFNTWIPLVCIMVVAVSFILGKVVQQVEVCTATAQTTFKTQKPVLSAKNLPSLVNPTRLTTEESLV